MRFSDANFRIPGTRSGKLSRMPHWPHWQWHHGWHVTCTRLAHSLHICSNFTYSSYYSDFMLYLGKSASWMLRLALRLASISCFCVLENSVSSLDFMLHFSFSDYNSVQNSTRGGQERVTHPVFYKKIGALRAQNLHIRILSQYWIYEKRKRPANFRLMSQLSQLCFNFHLNMHTFAYYPPVISWSVLSSC